MTRRNRTSRPVQPLSSRLNSRPPAGGFASMRSSLRWSVIIGPSWQFKLGGDRGEMALHAGLGHLGERRGAPARAIVLVDDHGPNALIEILLVGNARHDAKFRLHAFVKRPAAAAPHLHERNL